LGIKIFNDLRLEIKNVAGNQKKFKIALKKFLNTYSFYTMEKYLSQSLIMYCITRFLLQWYTDLRFYVYYVSTLGLFLSFCLGTLLTYSLTVYSELITFPCINLICLNYVL